MAIQTPTVFVIGAGASCELGFPSGPQLLTAVANALNIQFNYNLRTAGQTQIMEAIRHHHGTHRPDKPLEEYVYAGWRLRDSANIARSIDNAIDQNDEDALVPIVGKLAIASEILQAEARSKLFVKDHPDPTPQFGTVRETWLFHLGQMLSTDLKKTNAASAFDQVSFITFNYDRSLEHFLPSVFVEAYGLNVIEAREISSRARIFHPYGKVGHLPWMQQGAGAVGYGRDPGGHLVDIANGLQTFTESVTPDQDLFSMHELLTAASQIVFLGFGYHRQNMNLLQPANSLTAARVYGTVYKEPAAAIESATIAIRNMVAAGPNPRPFDGARLENMTCADFMWQHYSPLTG